MLLHRSHRLRRSGIAAGLALVGTAAVVPPADAASTTLTYACTFLQTGATPVPVSVTWRANLPFLNTVPDSALPTTVYRATVSTPLAISAFLGTVGASSLEATASASISGGFPNASALLTFPRTPLAAGLLSGRGTAPTPRLSGPSQLTLGISRFAIQLTPRRADGSGYSWTDLGDNGLHPAVVGPASIGGNCTLDPSTQDATVATGTGFHGDAFPSLSRPSNPTFSDVRATQATLSWAASRPQISPGNSVPAPVARYVVVDDDGQVVATVPASSTPQAVLSGLKPGTLTGYTVYGYTSVGRSEPIDSVAVTTLRADELAPPPADTTAPSAPGQPGIGPSTDRSLVSVTWPVSTDDTAVASYEVTATPVAGSGASAAVTAVSSTPSATLSLPTGTFAVTVRALDAAGNVSAASVPTTIKTPLGDIVPPTAPGQPEVHITTTADDFPSTVAGVSWAPSTDDTAVTGYTLTIGKVSTGTTPDATAPIVIQTTTPSADVGVGKLQAGSTYDFTVTARDAAGNTSSASPTTRATAPRQSSPPTPTPTPTPAPTTTFAASGTATLKNLAQGSLPLNGSAKLRATAGDTFTGDLQLARTTANLKALGFLPVSATLEFAQTDQLVGTLGSGSASVTAKVRIKLPVIRAFGIQLGGGATCQATQVSTIPLTSVGAFSLTDGGRLAGTFAISNLSGCGALNGVISPLTAGGGNAIALSLVPSAFIPS